MRPSSELLISAYRLNETTQDGSLLASLRRGTLHGGSLSRLQPATAPGGRHLNVAIDDDDAIRRWPLLVQYQGACSLRWRWPGP